VITAQLDDLTKLQRDLARALDFESGSQQLAA
jgi:hypothetical protein